MEIYSTSIDIGKLALDGLYERQKAIASNAANVETPNYKRKDVVFEDELSKLIKKDDFKTKIKEQNSFLLKGKNEINANAFLSQNGNKDVENFLQTESFSSLTPEVLTDPSSFDNQNDNNVILEKEMMNMADSAMRYNVIATLEGKMFSGLQSVIKGGN